MNDQLNLVATAIQTRFAAGRQDFRDQAILLVSAENIIPAVQALRDEFGFALLSAQTAVDYGVEADPRFHVIYQLRDVQRNLLITLRVPPRRVDRRRLAGRLLLGGRADRPLRDARAGP